MSSRVSETIDQASVGRVCLSLLHFSDVYELKTLGGICLARVAGLRRQLADRGAPALVTFGGDLLGPSPLSEALVHGTPLAGRQMVATLNAIGVDCAVLGDRELSGYDEATVQPRAARWMACQAASTWRASV